MLMKAMGMGGGKNPAEMLKERLCEKGFDAFIYESPLDAMKKQIAAGEKPNINLYFAGKNAIDDFVSGMDLVITLCDVSSGRPSFGLSKGGGEIPWYVFELPVVVIGCGQPTMLADVPQAVSYTHLVFPGTARRWAAGMRHRDATSCWWGIRPVISGVRQR